MRKKDLYEIPMGSPHGAPNAGEVGKNCVFPPSRILRRKFVSIATVVRRTTTARWRRNTRYHQQLWWWSNLTITVTVQLVVRRYNNNNNNNIHICIAPYGRNFRGAGPGSVLVGVRRGKRVSLGEDKCL